MHAKHPGIAARWDKETGGKVAAKKSNPFAEKAKEMYKDKAKKKAAVKRVAKKAVAKKVAAKRRGK